MAVDLGIVWDLGKAEVELGGNWELKRGGLGIEPRNCIKLSWGELEDELGTAGFLGRGSGSNCGRVGVE